MGFRVIVRVKESALICISRECAYLLVFSFHVFTLLVDSTQPVKS